MSASALIPLLLCDRAAALSFSTSDGWQISLDTTLSAAAQIRTSDRDKRFIGAINGGTSTTPGSDNGSLNFAPGSVVAAPFRITEELDVHRENYGVFLRATGFWDPIYNGGIAPDFSKFPRATVRAVGTDLRLLDAYAFADANLFGHRFSFRVGNQAINWGESIFIQGGVNSASAFDANALQRPGAELREAVLPLPAVDVRTQITDDLSIEGFYEFLWVRTHFAPFGAFYSTNDGVSDGATYGILDQTAPDSPSSLNRLNLATNNVYGALLPRAVDHHPSDQGEFGIALRYTAPWLDDSEFGLYFENYHSRVPMGGYTTGTFDSVRANENLFFTGKGYSYNSTARYYATYPGNIKLLGLSFSTTIGDGIGLQGELTQRFDQPLLLSTADATFAMVSPYICQLEQDLLAAGLGALAGQAGAACNEAHSNPVVRALGGVPGFEQDVPQYKRYNVTQFQVSATKLLPPMPDLYISSWTAIAEAAVNVVDDFPGQAAIFDNAFSTSLSSAFSQAAASSKGLAHKNFVTQAAGGVVGALVFDMPELLPYGIGTKPDVAIFYSVAGRDAFGAGDFTEGQAAVSLGVDFTYLNSWKLALNYVNHFGVGPTDTYQLVDRDYVTATLSYNF